VTESEARAQIRTLTKSGMDPILEEDEITSCVAEWASATGSLFSAVAMGWRIKQAACADRYDITTGGDIASAKRDQVFQHCGRMAEFYEGKAGINRGVTSVQPTRGERCTPCR
jgi:hypothetical protein